MNSMSASDTSLYDLALSSDQPSLVLQVSPATLKSVVGSFMDLLIDRKVSAIVWAKLPRGDIWSSELERYSLLPGVTKTIFQFRNHRDEGGDDASMVSTAIARPTDASNTTPISSATDFPEMPSSFAEDEQGIIPIQLTPESNLRREYFLLIWATELQALVLAHRPRSAQVMKTATNASDGEAASTDAGTLAEEGHDRRQNLLATISLDRDLISRILQGIETTTELSRARFTQDNGTNSASSQPNWVSYWQQLISDRPLSEPNTHLLGQLLIRQLQQQEEFWQRSSTYRKQAEIAELLQVQNAELTNAIRLKDDFLNNVGQELRTPLTTIKTALTLLNSPNIKPPQRQRYMDLIAKECDRQSSLITSLLDLVQLEQVVDQSSLQPIRLSEVVPGVVSIYQPVAEEKGVMLAYTVPEDLPPVSCMNNWLKQIVINLLNNGIKYTPQGGQVWVRAKQQGDYVQLEFRDTGIGIAPGEVPKIFERFYRVRQASEESASGAGLGLTIVQQLLIHCGGSISVRSRPGEGSTFNVLLPVHRTTVTS